MSFTTYLQGVLKPLIDEAVDQAVRDANLALKTDVDGVIGKLEAGFESIPSQVTVDAESVANQIIGWMQKQFVGIPVLGQLFGFGSQRG